MVYIPAKPKRRKIYPIRKLIKGTKYLPTAQVLLAIKWME
jgi:hypothetical protein